MDATPFENRLRKNWRHRRRWAARQGLTAYRIYDSDIPEWPYAIDWYDGRVHVVDYPRRSALKTGEADAARAAAMQVLQSVLDVPAERIFWKVHRPMEWGKEQYGRLGHRGETGVVVENGLRFEVNLSDYLDTGLFLDHRVTRARVRSESRGKRFLNLFAYTGAFTVYAAAGGARESVSVDLSSRYCEWAERNLALNGLSRPQHRIVCTDAWEWVKQAPRRSFGLCVLDPPSFSASKRARTFDVQRDHAKLLADVVELLAPGGVMYFSTNFRQFEMKADLLGLRVEELNTIPEDFRGRPHLLWRIERPA